MWTMRETIAQYLWLTLGHSCLSRRPSARPWKRLSRSAPKTTISLSQKRTGLMLFKSFQRSVSCCCLGTALTRITRLLVLPRSYMTTLPSTRFTKRLSSEQWKLARPRLPSTHWSVEWLLDGTLISIASSHVVKAEIK